ncbi:bile acid:sodium symporter family protein [Virgibacillus oceani]|uniref:Sodium transporter n=1 Tax=Virgibacillus oceani TaxID=1479511 RepID=A0A917HGZ8_9BACI|nr:bile acid:sodium symporter family protein [Virgibacillus oceani]GGG79218.1 sodium transporter [Virgibacillus oceani]
MKTLELVGNYANRYFAVWVILASVVAFFSPGTFTWIGPYITPLLGVIMFGMGLTLKLSDFKIVFRKPVPVIIGVIAQFVIMPLVAFCIAKLLNLPPELAAGLVLVGSCPGGTASNVMVYLSKGDLPLSVAMTSVSTILAPILTPTLLLVLAGQWLPVEPVSMFLSIVKIIIVPIGLGIIANFFFPRVIEKSTKALPLVSVVAIIAIVTAVVGLNQSKIATTGMLVMLAVVLHNVFGLILGYLTALVLRLDETQRRAISIEVGMQNSGLGASLATTYFSPLAALPSAIFSVWHNISGPIVASFWSQHPVNKVTDEEQSEAYADTSP